MALQKCDIVLNVFNVDILVYEDKQAKDISLHWKFWWNLCAKFQFSYKLAIAVVLQGTREQRLWLITDHHFQPQTPFRFSTQLDASFLK